MKSRLFLYIFCPAVVFWILWTGCEKKISIDLHQSDQKLVVEGTIENGKQPRVILTHSLNYFSSIDTTILKTMFVHDAKILVSGDGDTVRLSEHSVDTLNGNKFYYYAPDTAGLFIGKVGQAYSLHIEVGNKVLNAITTIPAQGFQVDSLWWLWGVKDKAPDTTKAFLMLKINDPPQAGNYARYFTKTNEEPFYPGLASVADDEITNGTTFDFQLDRGVNKNVKVSYDDYGYFNPGDTVTLKFCNIDEATYAFWHTWEYAWSNNGNPFSTPTTILGNIPGALGYWGGYAAQYRTIIITK